MKNINMAMKFLTIILIVVFLSACTAERIHDTPRKSNIQTVCIEGVEYYLLKERSGYYGWGFMSVKFNPDSTVSTC